jgi:serine/threonine-protein phosphatase 6 catalytic subunit
MKSCTVFVCHNVLYLYCGQIRIIDRNCEIPHEGPFCDLMWSDPEEIETWTVSPRGAGWLFGSRVTQEVQKQIDFPFFFYFRIVYFIQPSYLLGSSSTQFNHINKIELVCRAHQLVQEGLKYMFDKGLVTVSSLLICIPT